MFKCPVCLEHEFERKNDFEICDVCGWGNDGVQSDNPDWDECFNKRSLNEARAAWSTNKNKSA